MRILITGGNGYVGRALTRHLFNEHSISVVDSLRIGPVRFTPEDSQRFRMFSTDIRDFDALQRVFLDVRPEIIVHLAALHFIPECERLPDEAISINTLGTANVVRACPEGSRIVYTSTAAVYAPDSAPHHEERSKVQPMDVYGLTKLHGEDYVRHWAHLRSLQACVVRLFNVIGPGETNPHVVPAILAQVLKGCSVLRLGNVSTLRDYIHVGDVVRGLSTLALAQHTTRVDTVNLGSGRAYSVADLVNQLSAIIGRPLTIQTDPSRARATDRPFLAADIGHIQTDYGWVPAHGITDSLRDLWAHPDIPQSLLDRA